MTLRAWEALAILLVVGTLITLFLWLFVGAVCAAGDARRDRARSWTRDC